MRKNELELRFLYKLGSNETFTKSLVTQDDSEDYNFEDNERATRPTGVHFIILEWRYIEEQKKIEKNIMT